MSLLLYDRSTGEIRARLFDEAQSEITNATVTCTLENGEPRPQVVFSGRAMAYNGTHPFTDTGDLGCYFCVASPAEMTGAQGTWKATITAVDSLANTLVATAYINVTPFVVS